MRPGGGDVRIAPMQEIGRPAPPAPAPRRRPTVAELDARRRAVLRTLALCAAVVWLSLAWLGACALGDALAAAAEAFPWAGGAS